MSEAQEKNHDIFVFMHWRKYIQFMALKAHQVPEEFEKENMLMKPATHSNQYGLILI